MKEKVSHPKMKTIKSYWDILVSMHHNKLFPILIWWDAELMKENEMQRIKNIISHLFNLFWERVENFLFL